MSKINFKHNFIASNLRYLREREHLGRTKLAKRLKIPLQKIDRIERGEAIDIDTLIIYSEYFELPIDRIAREDLSISKSNTPILKDDINISKDNISISKNEKPLSENEVKALNCAKGKGFNCPDYENKIIRTELCKDCFNAPFWEKKDIAKELYDISVSEPAEDGEEYLNCVHFQKNPNPNCYFRNSQNLRWDKCQKCLRDIARWGEMAIGYKREVGK